MKEKIGKIIIAIVLIIAISGCINGDEIDYASKIDEALMNGPVVAYFHADWCAACKLQSPIIEDLKNEYGEYISFIIVNTDEDATAMRKHGVRSIPTTIVFASRENDRRHVGATEKEILNESIQWAIANYGIGE
ncbi:MAG: thioredoxin family protein [Methanosarcinaceae archaeon]|jgi:thioredoxin 1|nr:thioredoxin family protein [Methanosarcinaceae archaeon]NKQ39854.1 thioredoxin family protein [Methanosarcinales archaeon]